MKTCRTGALPPDLKSFSTANRHEELKEALYTIVVLILMVALFWFVLVASVPFEPRGYPAG